MSVKIVADSAANMHTLEGIDFASAPLTIRTADREFVDNASLDILEMVDYLGKYKGKSGSAVQVLEIGWKYLGMPMKFTV